jgi:hypothetical protein
MPSAGFRRVMVLVVVGMALTAVAQSNSSPPYARWFVASKPRLRTMDTEPPAPGSNPQDGQVNLSSSPTMSRSVDLTAQRSDLVALSPAHEEGDAERYYLRQPNFGFTRTARVPDNFVARGLDSVFRPEEFRVGRTATVSCSILTAITRRNPFCLLNPIILNVSW